MASKVIIQIEGKCSNTTQLLIKTNRQGTHLIEELNSFSKRLITKHLLSRKLMICK